MDRRFPAVLSAGLLALATAPAAFAQAGGEDLQKEIEALKQGQAQIRKDLADIKRLVQQSNRPAAPSRPNVTGKVFDIGNNPVKGLPSASLTLIEFLDYQ